MSVADKNNLQGAPVDDAVAGRHALMAALAGASTAEIERGLKWIGRNFGATDLRPAETGLVMLRGRIGGDGAAFNFGEATVTRAVVQIASGEKGVAYMLGRDRKKARLAALCDALWQSMTHRQEVEQNILMPLQQAQQSRRAQARAQTAATRVDFFTLVRGEDQS